MSLTTRSGWSRSSACASSLRQRRGPARRLDAAERGVQVHALAAAGDRAAGPGPCSVRTLADQQRDLGALAQPGAGAGVEVEHEPVRVAAAARPRPNRHCGTCISSARDLAEPGQRGQVVQHRVVDGVAVGVLDRVTRAPSRARASGRFFSKKTAGASRCRRRARQRLRVTGRSRDVRDAARRRRRVVGEHVAPWWCPSAGYSTLSRLRQREPWPSDRHRLLRRALRAMPLGHAYSQHRTHAAMPDPDAPARVCTGGMRVDLEGRRVVRAGQRAR